MEPVNPDPQATQVPPAQEPPATHLIFDSQLANVYVIFITTQDLIEVQPPWQRACDSNMDKTNQIIQALSRAAVDRSTTYRFSFGKCFGISNTKSPSTTTCSPSMTETVISSLNPKNAKTDYGLDDNDLLQALSARTPSFQTWTAVSHRTSFLTWARTPKLS